MSVNFQGREEGYKVLLLPRSSLDPSTLGETQDKDQE